VYGFLSARAFHQSENPLEMVLGFGAATLLCVASTVIPIRMALRRLEDTELS
jgi:hypothetical protein